MVSLCFKWLRESEVLDGYEAGDLHLESIREGNVMCFNTIAGTLAGMSMGPEISQIFRYELSI